MYRRYKAAGVVLGAIFMAMVSMDTQAAQLGEDLSVGIASTFDQTTNTEEETQATIRCVPFAYEQTPGTDMVSGKPATCRVIIARSY